jgi:hypothetical protein
MPTYISRLPHICVLMIIWLLINAPVQAQNCYLTDEQIREIRFHYDLDKYMVGGCIIGSTFGAITGLLTMSGITVVASVPYIATGCSLGFFVGASSMTLYNWFSTPESNSKQAIKDTWNQPN